MMPRVNQSDSPSDDVAWMRLALNQARLAARVGEVPVGAVVVKDGQLVSSAHNAPIALSDPSAHAEMIALREAGKALGNYRLDGCTLYVTLEPCAMCSGAMLHARLDRVVFGAPDSKTGAAGGVLDLFAQSALNHGTQVKGGVLASECADVLKSFFKPKRLNTQPVRQDALRTPENRFNKLPDFPWKGQYMSHLPSLDGLRLHYLDEGVNATAQDGQTTYVLLHDAGSWGYEFRHMIPVFVAAGGRVLVPDLVGFGKSDKPKKATAHSLHWHLRVMTEWITAMGLTNVVLVASGWGAMVGLACLHQNPRRFKGVLVIDACLPSGTHRLPSSWLAHMEQCRKAKDWTPACLPVDWPQNLNQNEIDAFHAPFPDRGHCAALRALPDMMARLQTEEEGTGLISKTDSFLRTIWRGRTVFALRSLDPDLKTAMVELQQTALGCENSTFARGASFDRARWEIDLAAHWLADAVAMPPES